MLGKFSKSLQVKTEKKILKRRHSLVTENPSRWTQLMTPFNGNKNQQSMSPHNPVQFATQLKNPRSYQIYSKDSSPSNIYHHSLLDTKPRERKISDGSLIIKRGTEGNYISGHVQIRKPFPLTIRKCSTEQPIDRSEFDGNKKSCKESIEDQNSSVISFENYEESSPKFDINEFAADWSHYSGGLNPQTSKPHFGRSHTAQPSDLVDLNLFNFSQVESKEKICPDFQEERLRLSREKRPVTILKSNNEISLEKNLASPLQLRDTPDFTKDVKLSSIKLNLQENMVMANERNSAEDTPNFENRGEINPPWGGIDLNEKGDLQRKILKEKGDLPYQDEEKDLKIEVSRDKSKNLPEKDMKICENIEVSIFGHSNELTKLKINSNGNKKENQVDSKVSAFPIDQNIEGGDMSWARVSFDPQEMIKKFQFQSRDE